MDSTRGERICGLIVGNHEEPIQTEILDYFTDAGFVMDRKGINGEVCEALARGRYDFIFYFDSPEESRGPEFLDQIEKTAPGKKVIILFEPGEIKKYLGRKRSNVFGYLSVHSNISILHFLVRELLMETRFSLEPGKKIPGHFPNMNLNFN